jgi:membrane protease YdiL (CAAX protease family)
MASTSTQPELEIVLPPGTPSVSNAHRWIDLGLVLMVAFAAPVMGSIDRLFHPAPITHSSVKLGLGILDEAIALLLFFVLFRRQGRRLQDIGFNVHWADLPKAFGLVITSFGLMWVMALAVPYVYFLVTLNTFHDTGPSSTYFDSSLWLLVPFLILNPFFEEILVRGYLMTEWIDLRKSVVLAAVISLAFQTSYHLYYGVFGAAIVGCGLSVFAIYYAKSRRLMPVILAHMLWDFTIVLSRLHHAR